MPSDNETETPSRTLYLDGTLLELDPKEEAFFKAETGIQDTDELKKYITEVQEEAYKVYPYPCIRGFRFAKLKIARMPVYPRVLKLAKNRPDAVFLDIGCCLGTEVRKIIHDGWPMSQTIATDLKAEFWNLGHKLFKTTPETFPAKFLVGDAFDDSHISLTAPAPSSPPPPIASVNSLTELRGHVSAIHASSLFHLFEEEKQLELGKRLAALLDPRPGSIIFGSHGSKPVKGHRLSGSRMMFCHSPESWTQMWEEQIFEKGQVKVNWDFRNLDLVDVEGRERAFPAEGGTHDQSYWLTWSVERL